MNGYKVPVGFDNLINWDELLLTDNVKVEKEKIKLSGTSSGLTYSQTSQHQLNKVETSEASYRTKSGGGRLKLTLDQIREKKKQSDHKYRQKKKGATAEQTAENKRLKVANEELNAENKRLKRLVESLTCHGLLPADARQREDTCIAQSTNKQLYYSSVSVQVATVSLWRV